ncbi:MAG TPA: sensor domain-containing phosphodiesterase [Stellaceae bacterium]|nr:sensor domain-containing phosphodiesterase [Stellaceae bacterium]
MDGAAGHASPLDPSVEDLRHLRADRDRFVGFAFAGGELLLEVAPDRRIMYAAGAVKSITGGDPPAIVGRAIGSLFAAPELRLLDQALQQAKRRGRLEPITLTIERAPGDAVRVVLTGRQLPGKDESLYLVINRVGTFPAAARFDEKHDTETGLLDQQSFAQAAKALLRSEDRPDNLSLALVRLQGLTDLRTRSGDDAVDALLREIGALLRLNAVDGTAAGRLAGDKFGVVRATLPGDTALKPEIERLVRPLDPQGKTVKVHEQDVQLDTGTLTSADVARALAYTLGRFVSDSGEFSLPTLVDGFRAQVADAVSRISQIKSVVLAKKIDVAFQPIVALEGRAIHHYEMLARFEAGASPYELINFAEQIGLIEDIDLFICQRGISILASLRNKASFAINISARSLGSDMFVQSLIGLCGQHPALRERLLFEVTESAAIKDLARAGRILTELREAGHGICLDDFGAGSSSFPYLQALPVDFVKIDGAYVDRMAMSRKDRAILVAMASMCKELEVAAIAEKIEHEEQARTLRELGVDFGQGYLFGRPTLAPTGFAA